MLQVVEDIGSTPTAVIEWAQAAGNKALEWLGEATVRIGNAVNYVLAYLEEDFLPGVAKFVKGVLNAGYALAQLVTWMTSRSVAVVVETTEQFPEQVTLARRDLVKSVMQILEAVLAVAGDALT